MKNKTLAISLLSIGLFAVSCSPSTQKVAEENRKTTDEQFAKVNLKDGFQTARQWASDKIAP